MFSFFKRKKNKKSPINNDPFVTDYADNTPKENTSFQEMKEKASEISDNIQESTSGMLDNAREAVDNTLDNAKESIEESFDDVQEKTSDMIDNFKNNEDEDINDNTSDEDEDEDKDIVGEEELSEEFTTISNENSPEHKLEEDIIAKDSNEEECENKNEDLGEDSENNNELPSEVISGEYVPEDSEEENTPFSEDHHEEEDVLESTKPEDNPEENMEESSVNSENNEENHEDDTSIAEKMEVYDEEVAADTHPIIDEENIENGKTIPLFPGNDIFVEESEIDDFINESKEIGDAENNDDSQIAMNFNSASFEEDDESDPLDIEKIQDQEDYDEEKEVRKSIAFNVQKLIDSKSYPLILAIKENDDAIKEELTSIIGKNTVFLVDFTESRNGYKIIPDSANREFAPINNEGDSSYLDGIDIINLIKNSEDKYDGSFIIIAGIDNITNKVSHTLSGNQIAIDMIYEKIKTNIQEAVENNITVIGTGYELSEPLSDFIDQLSLEDIIEEHESSEKNKSIVTSSEKEVEDGEENVIEHAEYNINERVDKEEYEPEEVIEEKTTENDEDNDNMNTVDEYLKSMGKSSIEEGIEDKNKDVFVEDE